MSTKKTIQHVIPWMFSFITRKERYIPETDWSSNSLIHNIFRVYEIVFGRQYGVRAESSVYIENGRAVYDFFTFEAGCAFVETCIRDFFFKIPRPRVVKVYIPVLARVGMQKRHVTQRPYLFAIALDATSTPTVIAGNSPKTITFTTTGSNRMLVASTYYNPGGSETPTVTYNNVSMTKVVEDTAPNGVMGDMYLLQAPSTGSNTLSATSTDITRPLSVGVVSYTGVNQSVTPDSSNHTNGTASSVTLNTTVVQSNCWLVLCIENQVSDIAGTGATRRVNGSTTTIRNSMYDSNGIVGTGSQGMTVSFTNGGFASLIISLAPPSVTSIWTKTNKSSTPTWSKPSKSSTSWSKTNKS